MLFLESDMGIIDAAISNLTIILVISQKITFEQFAVRGTFLYVFGINNTLRT